MHKFDAGGRNRSIPESLEPKHRAQPKFDGSMVLLDEIVQIFRRSQVGSLAAPMFAEELPSRPVGRLIAIECDRTRQSALGLERPPEEGFRRGNISLRSQQEIHRLSPAVDSAIEIRPTAFDLHVGFVDPP